MPADEGQTTALLVKLSNEKTLNSHSSDFSNKADSGPGEYSKVGVSGTSLSKLTRTQWQT